MESKRDYGPAVAKACDTIHKWCPGWMQGQRTGKERKIRSPLRDDKNIGSFSINEDTGEWYDFATCEGGDALTLYARIKGITNGQARAEIMGEVYDEKEEIEVDPILRANIAAGIHDEEMRKAYLDATAPDPEEEESKKEGPKEDGTKKEGASGKEVFPLVKYGSLTLEPPRWLIKGILEDNSLGVIFGASGHGKSYLVLDMAACIASGYDFHGRKTKQTGAVVYIAGEGHAGLSKRLRAWEIKTGADLSKAPLYISMKPAALCDDDYMRHVVDAVTRVGSVQRVALIIVDTWARNMAGDENSTVDTTTAIRAVDDLRALYQCTAIVVHHSGQAESERGRGSSALRAALDIEYKVEINNGIMMVKNTKMKDGEPPELMTFSFDFIDIGIDDEEGEPVTSAALDEIVLDGIVGKPKKKGKIQTMILEKVKENGGNMDKRDLREAMPNVAESSFFSAISTLISNGEMVQDGNIFRV